MQKVKPSQLPSVFVTLAALAAITGCAGGHGTPEQRLEDAKKWVRLEFPTVRHVSTQEVEANLERILLLDARSRREFDVSHLPGARWLDPDSPAPLQVADVPTDTPLIVYCSVGYRSSKTAASLAAAGWTNVSNLDGGIFQWSNEGRMLEPAGTTAVHPYNSYWGKMLNQRAGVSGSHISPGQ